MEEKEALCKFCKQYKHEFDPKVAELSKKVINYNDKMKKHTKPITREGYIARAVSDFYPDLRNVKHNDPNLQAAVNLGKRCNEQLLNSESTCKINVGPSKSKYRKPETVRRTTIPDVKEALFDWFIDIRKTSLHLPDGIKYNWAPKGSYRLEQMLYTISNLPNKYNIFTPKN